MFWVSPALVSCDIILLQGELEVSELHLDEDTFMMYGHGGGWFVDLVDEKQLDDYHILDKSTLQLKASSFANSSQAWSVTFTPICLHANPEVMICNWVWDPNVSWVFFQLVCCWMILPVMNSSSLSLSRGFFLHKQEPSLSSSSSCNVCCNSRLPPEGCKLDNHQQYVIKWTDLERRMWPIGVWSILITEAP